MSKPDYVRVFRVFLSSPGDVADERNLVRDVLKRDLPSRAFLRDRATFEVVSWYDPAAPTPMLATLTPQEAVNRRDKPSACDIVVVILWSRLGTPLPDTFTKPNGERYLSGTDEWEYEDACNAQPPPDILVYRRTSPSISFP